MKLEKELNDSRALIMGKDLKIGEMMMVDDNECNSYDGEILLRTSKYIVSLSCITHCWENETPLRGYKLLPGESVTLIQE